MEGVTITFENELKTRKAVITITRQRATYEVDLEYIPMPKTAIEHEELYIVMAGKFVKHLANL